MCALVERLIVCVISGAADLTKPLSPLAPFFTQKGISLKGAFLLQLSAHVSVFHFTFCFIAPDTFSTSTSQLSPHFEPVFMYFHSLPLSSMVASNSLIAAVRSPAAEPWRGYCYAEVLSSERG